MKALNPILLSGKEVLPLVEGGKGVAITNGASSGAWAAAGGNGGIDDIAPGAYDIRAGVDTLVRAGDDYCCL